MKKYIAALLTLSAVLTPLVSKAQENADPTGYVTYSLPSTVIALEVDALSLFFGLLIGSTLGGTLAQIFGLSTRFGAAIGMTAFFLRAVLYNVMLGKKIGETVVLAPPMLKMLPAMFTWPQLFTALIGGTAALLMVPVLRKALRK